MTKVPPASSSQGSPQAAEEVSEERLTDKKIQQHPRIPPNQPITALCGAPSPALAFELSRPLTTKSVPGITQSKRIVLLDPTLPFWQWSRAPRAEGARWLFTLGPVLRLRQSRGLAELPEWRAGWCFCFRGLKIISGVRAAEGGERVRNYCFQGYL